MPNKQFTIVTFTEATMLVYTCYIEIFVIYHVLKDCNSVLTEYMYLCNMATKSKNAICCHHSDVHQHGKCTCHNHTLCRGSIPQMLKHDATISSCEKHVLLIQALLHDM